MNKLVGFYELKHSSLPSIPWEEYHLDTRMNPEMLWTVRSAINRGNDLNLPRMVGVSATEASNFASQLYHQLKEKGMVIYYPYFIAEKSGTLNIFPNKMVIEAVKNDLWNLVTYSDREVTVMVQDDRIEYDGNADFLDEQELEELIQNARKAKSMFKDELLEGKSALLEWSYAFNCDLDKKKIGKKYLVFYEARTV